MESDDQIEPKLQKKVKRTISSASGDQNMLLTKKSRTDQFSDLSLSDKKLKVIKFEDPIILRVIQKNQIQWLEKLCFDQGIKIKLKIDKFNAYLELFQCIQNQLQQQSSQQQQQQVVQNKDNFNDIEQQINEIKYEIEKNILIEKIPCSVEEYKFFKKQLPLFYPELQDQIEIKYIQSLGNNQIKLEDEEDYQVSQKPTITNQYIVNGRFIIKIAKFDNPANAGLSKFDVCLFNTDKNGIYIDQLANDIAQGHKNLKHRIKEASENKMLKEGLISGLTFTEGKEQKQIQLCIDVLDNPDKAKEHIIQFLQKIELQDLIQESFLIIGIIVPSIQDIDQYFSAILKYFIEKGEDDSILQFPSELYFICNNKQQQAAFNYFQQVKESKTINVKKKKKGGYWVYKLSMQQQQQNVFGGLMAYPYNAQNQYQEEKFSDQNSIYIDLAQNKNKKSVRICLPPKPPLPKPVYNQFGGYNYNYNQKLKRKKNKNELDDDDEDPSEKISINFEAMVEELKQSNIFRPMLKLDDMKMQFQDTISQQFKNYEPELNEVFQDIMEVGMKQYDYERSLIDNSLKSRIMKINFKKYTMKDIETNEVYEINRVEDDTVVLNLLEDQDKDMEGIIYIQEVDKSEFAEAEEEKKNKISDEVQQQQNNLQQIPYAQIRGLKDSLKTTITIFDDIKNKKYVQHNIYLDKEIKEGNIQQIKELLMHNNVELEGIKNNVVTLKGYAKTINRVRNEVIKISEIQIEALTFPPDWQPQQENCKLFEVDIKSEDAKQVIKRCKQSMPQMRVIKIQRIQNKTLWKNYMFEKTKMEQKGNAKEKMLFHGTRQTDPSLIFQGTEEGFDFRLAAPGLYGTGIYFAETSAYSAAFAHPLKNGNSNFFLAKVLVGNIYVTAPQQLRLPPYLPGKKNARYDSVRGANNSPEHVIYNNNKAYPYYLIEFKNNNQNQLGGFGAGFGAAYNQYNSDSEEIDEENNYNSEDEY